MPKKKSKPEEEVLDNEVTEETEAEEVEETEEPETTEEVEESEEESEGDETEAEEEEPAEEEVSEEDEKAIRNEIVKELISEMEKPLADTVAKTVEARLNKKKEVTKANKEKKEKMSGDIKVKDVEIPIYKSASGKLDVTLGKRDCDQLAKWVTASVNKDFAEARKLREELDTKGGLEPMNETTAADGGYLVPTILTNILIDMATDMAVIRPRATVLDLSGPGDTFALNQVASLPKTAWTNEQTAKSTTSMVLDQITLTPYKLTAIMSVTLELLQDSASAVIPLITRQLAKAIARDEDTAFMTGNGTGRPTGIDNYTLRSFVGGALNYDDFVRAYYLLPQDYRESGNASWIMNSRTIAAALSLKDSNNRPLLVEGSTDHITGRPVRTILGCPILEHNKVASSKIFFGDLSQYYIGDKMQMRIDTSNEATVADVSAFEQNLTHIRVEERVDGELADTRAFVEITGVQVS